MHINDYFAERASCIANNYPSFGEKILFVFKGFGCSQIKWILNHPKTLLRDDKFFIGEDIDICYILNKWFDILQAIMTADGNRMAFYEQLLAVQANLSPQECRQGTS